MSLFEQLLIVSTSLHGCCLWLSQLILAKTLVTSCPQSLRCIPAMLTALHSMSGHSLLRPALKKLKLIVACSLCIGHLLCASCAMVGMIKIVTIVHCNHPVIVPSLPQSSRCGHHVVCLCGSPCHDPIHHTIRGAIAMILLWWHWFGCRFSITKKHVHESAFLLQKRIISKQGMGQDIRPIFCRLFAFKHLCHLGLKQILLWGFSLSQKSKAVITVHYHIGEVKKQ